VTQPTLGRTPCSHLSSRAPPAVRPRRFARREGRDYEPASALLERIRREREIVADNRTSASVNKKGRFLRAVAKVEAPASCSLGRL